MKVLMISGDANLLKNGSAARERRATQESVVEKLEVFVWPSMHSASQIRRAARAERWDVITAQDPFWRGLLAWRLARRAGARLNVQVHADLAGQPAIKRLLARFVLPRADSIRAVSSRVKDEVVSLGVTAPVHVLPVFIDAHKFANIEHVPGLAKTILWIGRFEAEKDPLKALDVFKEVRTKISDARLVMLGNGSLEKSLRSAAEGLPIQFPGWGHTRDYLATADVVLSTSPYESYGASIVEALAAGVPVVAPDVGVAREAGAIIATRAGLAERLAEVLRSGERGRLLLPILSAEEWARAWRASL